MAYKYANILPINITTGCLISNELQAMLDESFEVSSDVFTIGEEATLGTNVFTDIRVRINRAINTYTGEKLGDDFKLLMFSDLNHALSMGKKFYFDSCYWIVYNVEAIKNLASSCTVRRCNNQLRWMDTNGVQYTEPCSIEYQISRGRDDLSTSDLVVPAGYIKIFCQLNTNTKKIKGNQRFLLGPASNRVAIKVFGNGVRNYLNNTTLDDESATLLELWAGGNFINSDTDNITLGIADYYQNYGNLRSGSNIGALDIVVTPSINYILESGSCLYTVYYYSGSTALSGSFVFSVSGSGIPTDHYVFATESNNTFSVYNIAKYTDSTLDILCSGSSGSRLINLQLRGAW